MARRMHWRRARLGSVPKQSVRDERDLTERDLAARWLEHHEGRLRGNGDNAQNDSNKTRRKIAYAQRKTNAPPTRR
jgi:hypothetical protein